MKKGRGRRIKSRREEEREKKGENERTKEERGREEGGGRRKRGRVEVSRAHMYPCHISGRPTQQPTLRLCCVRVRLIYTYMCVYFRLFPSFKYRTNLLKIL